MKSKEMIIEKYHQVKKEYDDRENLSAPSYYRVIGQFYLLEWILDDNDWK